MSGRRIRFAVECIDVVDRVAARCRKLSAEGMSTLLCGNLDYDIRMASAEKVGMASGLSMRTVGLSVGSDASDSALSDYYYEYEHEL